MKKKIVFLPYDMDTAIGINNEGALVFSYNLEDIDKITDQNGSSSDVYNGQQSVLWKNIRACFNNELANMYQTLRSQGKLSYDVVENAFEEHQAKWSEAIFNEDAWFKYLQPLTDDGDASYLSMLQGSKKEQRKWWLYNRFRYLDSKYNAGDALTDVIQLRGYAKSDITVVPYADIYSSIKYGSYLTQKRASRNNPVTLVCPLDNVNDTEIYIYSASQLASVGDLSGLKVGFADFSKATKLQNIKIGDSSSGYSNGNLTTLNLGNNVLLKTLDVRNCSNLSTAINLSGCTNIEEVYFEGTKITGVTLPNGGFLKKLHLPNTITNLTLRNQRSLSDFVIGGYNNISTLFLENMGSSFDVFNILSKIPSGSRVRLIGFDITVNKLSDFDSKIEILNTMRGLDENGNNMDKAQVSGLIHVDTTTGAEIKKIQDNYPNIKVAYNHITSNLYYYNWEGTSILYTEAVVDGQNGKYTGSPSHSSDARANYTFVGWSSEPYATTKDNMCRANIVADRNVYAAYTLSLRYYTVYFYNGSTQLQAVQNIPYGGSASYTGATPVSVDGDDWEFIGWKPLPTNIQGNTSCYAQYESPLNVIEITDTWEQIIASTKDGSYKTKYQVGNYKPINLGEEGIINMQIAAKDKDKLADGSGYAPLTFVSKELLTTSKRFNPSLETKYSDETDVNLFRVNTVSWSKDYTTLTCGAPSQKSWKSRNDIIDIEVEAKFTLKKEYGKSSEYQYLVFGFVNDNYNNNDVFEFTYNNNNIEMIEYSKKSAYKYFVVNNPVLNIGDSFTIKIKGKIHLYYFTGDNVSQRISFHFTDELNENGYTNMGGDTPTGQWEIIKNQTISVNLFEQYTQNTGSIGGWENSELRSYYVDTIKPLIPDTIRNSIKTITKHQSTYDTTGKMIEQHTNDDVWIPSCYEMFGYSPGSSTETTNCPRYKSLFFGSDSRKKQKYGASSNSWYWLRSASTASYFYNVNGSGINYSNYAYYSNALVLGFCL